MSLLFSQSLSGLIKALRGNRANEQLVVQTALDEIASEVKASDWDIKAAAVLKLIYLEMLGHPAILAYAFNVLECMACPRFHIKEIGYLAASLSFAASTEVILLANNLVRKDLTASSSPSVVILALTSLPALVVASPQLAEDILPDLVRMLTHSKPRVRRMATLVAGKIWCTQYPSSADEPTMTTPSTSSSTYSTIEFSHIEKLRAGLLDEDPTVVSATVNVMLELARCRKDALPSLLPLAPELFDLLTNSTNNWMLIKVAKLFALLTRVEPRLVRKLLPPLTNLIATTPAFSLLYECIQTVITGGMLADGDPASPLARDCIEKLSAFLSDKDQNLRYIALKGLSRLLRNAPHTTPLLLRHYDDILACINEEDLTIRLKALELVERLTDRSNCKQIVTRLLDQISPASASPSAGKMAAAGMRSAAAALRSVSSAYDTASPSGLVSDTGPSPASTASSLALAQYKYRLLLLILRLTSRPSEDGSQLYVNVSNFEWYVDTLHTVAYLSLLVLPALSSQESVKLATKLSDALLDVTARAPSIRPFAVSRSARLLADRDFASLDNPVNIAVASACAFVLGEYGASDEHTVTLVNNIIHGSPSSDICLGAMECLSRWLLDVASAWREEGLAHVRRVLEATHSAMLKVPREDTVLYASLIEIVLEGLTGARRPQSIEEDETSLDASEDDNDALDNPFASSKPSHTAQNLKNAPVGGPPESMYFLYPIFAGYELRPLAPKAQGLVSPPEEIDFNQPVGDIAFLHSRLHSQSGLESNEIARTRADVDEYGRPKRAAQPAGYTDTIASSSEERSLAKDTSGKKKKKRKESKLHTGGAPALARSDEDVDAIPIVKLELSDRESSRNEKERPRRKKDVVVDLDDLDNERFQRDPSPPPLILTAGGDAPASRVPAVVPHPARSGVRTPAETGESSEAVQDKAEVKTVKKKKRKKAAVV